MNEISWKVTLPASLKLRVEIAAKAEGLSVDKWALRAFKRLARHRSQIQKEFDKVMKKVGKRKVPDWDRM